MLKQKNKGFTLVELMITLVVAAVLLIGLVDIYLSSMSSAQKAIAAANLEETLQNTLTVMTNDIQRTGYWGNAENNTATGTNNNPFMTADITINGSGNCILINYDRNGDGTLPSIGTGNDDERYGFRLQNNAVQSRPSGASFSCTAAANNWENITDPNVLQITQLSFVNNEKTVDIDGSGASTSSMKIRTITITITGQLASDSTVSKTLTMAVRVQNDKFVP